MTDEKKFARAKAIATLECMAIDLTGALAGLAKTNPMADVLEQRIEAIDTAQAALRERAERKSPCDLCRYNPPSSFDGKPCTMCPASAKEEV